MSTYMVWGREVQQSADDNSTSGQQGQEHLIYEGEDRHEYLNAKRNGGIRESDGVWLVPSRWEDGQRPEFSGSAANVSSAPGTQVEAPTPTPRKGEV